MYPDNWSAICRGLSKHLSKEGLFKSISDEVSLEVEAEDANAFHALIVSRVNHERAINPDEAAQLTEGTSFKEAFQYNPVPMAYKAFSYVAGETSSSELLASIALVKKFFQPVGDLISSADRPLSGMWWNALQRSMDQLNEGLRQQDRLMLRSNVIARAPYDPYGMASLDERVRNPRREAQERAMEALFDDEESSTNNRFEHRHLIFR